MALNVPRLHGPNDGSKAYRVFIGGRGKNMNRKEKASFRFGRGYEISGVLERKQSNNVLLSFMPCRRSLMVASI
jgi:hypothetical protein